MLDAAAEAGDEHLLFIRHAVAVRVAEAAEEGRVDQVKRVADKMTAARAVHVRDEMDELVRLAVAVLVAQRRPGPSSACAPASRSGRTTRRRRHSPQQISRRDTPPPAARRIPSSSTPPAMHMHALPPIASSRCKPPSSSRSCGFSSFDPSSRKCLLPCDPPVGSPCGATLYARPSPKLSYTGAPFRNAIQSSPSPDSPPEPSPAPSRNRKSPHLQAHLPESPPPHRCPVSFPFSITLLWSPRISRPFPNHLPPFPSSSNPFPIAPPE